MLGWQLLDKLDGRDAARLIEICLLLLTGIHITRRYILGSDSTKAKIPHTWWFIEMVAFLGGFTSTVANAAAPIMMLFFLSVGLPKLQFLGTGAWFFMFLNLFKIPFYLSIDLITMETVLLDLKLAPAVVLGLFIGRFTGLKIPQKGFAIFALTITVLASIRLIF